jgi:putative sugar O-methyltransferase
MNIHNSKNLIDSYNSSKQFLENGESKHWKNLNKSKLDLFFNAIDQNLSHLKKFRSDKFLSKGLDDAVETQFIPDVFFKLAEKNGAEKSLSYLQDKNVGESEHCLNIFNKYMDYHELFLVDYACILENRVLCNLSNPIICEIGGGYGSLARMICSKHASKYILIDLPEANLLSGYYLDQHFSSAGKKILYFSDLKKDHLSLSDIQDYDFIIIPPNINFTEDLKIDLFINTRSMMEMDFSTIEKYFALIQKSIKPEGYFLNINRYIKKTVGEEIMISRYPYDDQWRVTLSEKAFMQDHIHLLLAQRGTAEGSNIHVELELLEAHAKKYFEADSVIFLRKLLRHLKMLVPASIKRKLKSLLLSDKPE